MAIGFFNAEDSTPEQLMRRRQELDYLASRIGQKQTIGGGVGDLLTGIVGGLQRYRTNKSEQRGIDGANKLWSTFQPFAQQPPQATKMSGGEAFPNPAALPGNDAQRPVQGPSRSFGGYSGIPETVQAPKQPAPMMAQSGGGILPASFLSSVDRAEGAGSYSTLFGHAQKSGPFAGVDVSRMTVGDVIKFTDPNGAYAQSVKGKIGRVATPVGRHQIVGQTLRNAVKELNIDPNTPFNAATQDRVAHMLAMRRIASASSMPGKINALRSEWEGFKRIPDAQMAQIVADLERGGSGGSAPVQVASNDPTFTPTSAPPGDVSQETMQPVPVPQSPVQEAPQQVAQADNTRMNELMQLMANPFLDDSKKAIVQQLYAQELQRMDPKYQMDMQAGQLDLKYKQAQIDNMGDGDVVSVGGRLVNRKTGQIVYDPPQDTNDQNEWGLNPIPIRDPKTGQLKLMITNKSGAQKLMDLPEGFEAAPNLQYLDTGTGFVPVDKRGGSLPQEIAPVAKDVAGEASANVTGKLTAEANIALPGAETKGQEALSMIEQLANHPALASNTGGIEGRLPAVVQDMRDPKSADFRARLEQIKGQSFLSAFEALKGAGAITEQEGAAATKAMARLDQAQSEADFKTALSDLQRIIVKGIYNARVKAGKEQPASPESAPPPATQKRLKFNPATGELE